MIYTNVQMQLERMEEELIVRKIRQAGESSKKSGVLASELIQPPSKFVLSRLRLSTPSSEFIVQTPSFTRLTCSIDSQTRKLH